MKKGEEYSQDHEILNAKAWTKEEIFNLQTQVQTILNEIQEIKKILQTVDEISSEEED